MLSTVFICVTLTLCYVDFFAEAKLETEDVLEAGSEGKAFIRVVRNEFSTKELSLGIIF